MGAQHYMSKAEKALRTNQPVLAVLYMAKVSSLIGKK